MLLTEIGRIIGEARTLRDVLARVVELVADRMDTDVCAIWLLDASRTKLTMAAAEGLSAEAVGAAHLRKGEGITWRVLDRMEAVVSEDAQADPAFVFIPAIHEEPYHAYLGLPLQVRGLPIGVIYVQTKEPRRFTEDETRALSAIASQIAPVVDNARLLSLVAETPYATPAPDADDQPRRYYGTPCSSGVVAGPLLVLGASPPVAPGPTGTVEGEIKRLERACGQARVELLQMQEWLRNRNAEEAALVFTVQLMMLEDVSFEGRMRRAVEDGMSAHAAVGKVTRELVARFANLKDLFFRERSEDVQDLAGRLLRHIRYPGRAAGDELRGKIVLMPALGPSRLVSLCAEGVAAMLTGGGGATSHAALLARSLDLPLVVGLGDFIQEARTGERVLVDAASGEIVVDPPDEIVEQATRAASTGGKALRKAFGREERTSGRILFEANVSLWGDAVRARDENADGIGLYRTEFAFLMRPDLPGEEEQYVLYRRVADVIAPKPVTFRLLDAGGDKLVPALGQAPEPNPFLGYRSLRLLLDHPEILEAQARAIVRALEGTEGRLLVPMVGSVEEFEAVRAMLRKLDLALPPLGAMIEVPSALMDLDDLSRVANFLCVGTNDLTQHMLGVDRTNARVTRYFDVCHPAVVRALWSIAAAAKLAGKSLSICGEGASDPVLLPLWLGLGADRLAVHASRVRGLRTLEADLDPDEMRAAAKRIRFLRTPDQIRAALLELAAPEVREWATLRRAPDSA